jgi:hypothetical protein
MESNTTRRFDVLVSEPHKRNDPYHFLEDEGFNLTLREVWEFVANSGEWNFKVVDHDNHDTVFMTACVRHEVCFPPADPELLNALKLAVEGLDLAQAQVESKRDHEKLVSYWSLAKHAVDKAEGRAS